MEQNKKGQVDGATQVDRWMNEFLNVLKVFHLSHTRFGLNLSSVIASSVTRSHSKLSSFTDRPHAISPAPAAAKFYYHYHQWHLQCPSVLIADQPLSLPYHEQKRKGRRNLSIDSRRSGKNNTIPFLLLVSVWLYRMPTRTMYINGTADWVDMGE